MRGGGWVRSLAPVAVLGAMALVSGVACGDDGETEAPEGDPFTTGEDMETGGIEVDAPESWQPVAIPDLGFGLAVPEGWEAVVLGKEGLDALGQANPAVPDFAMSAVAAARAGAVFYAAGPDREDETRVDDLKVLADTSGDVEDVAGLEDYADETVTGSGLEAPTIEVVDDAPHPTVDVRFQSQGRVAHGETGGDEGSGEEPDEDVQVEGVQRFVLAPTGAVYSFIFTGESATSVEELAPELFATIAFKPQGS